MDQFDSEERGDSYDAARDFPGIVKRWDAKLLLGREIARRMDLDSLLKAQLPNTHFDDEEEYPEKYDSPAKRLAAMRADRGDSEHPMDVEMAALSIQEQLYGVTSEYIAEKLLAYGYVLSGIANEIEDCEPCECCRYKTIMPGPPLDQCRMCGWFSKYAEHEFSDLTLQQAQDNFALHGVCDPRHPEFADPEGKRKFVRKG